MSRMNKALRKLKKPKKKKKGWNQITRDKADSVFSDYIRLRDRKCVGCGVHGRPRKSDGLPVEGKEFE